MTALVRSVHCGAIPLAFAMLFAPVAGVASASAPGHIKGQVRLGKASGGRPLPSSAYASRVVHRASRAPGGELSNVLVYLTDAPPAADAPMMRAEIRQQGEQFVPHVVAITRGSVVDFPNFDPLFHNVFSLSGAMSFDLGRYPKGESRSRRFPKAGLVKVFCHLHSHMSAVIRVFDHTHFTTVAADGSFELSGVPPGRRILTAWHERVGEDSIAVAVEPGRTATADFNLPSVEP